MQNIENDKHFNQLLNMKWIPTSGKIELKPITPENLVVLQKGIFVTDNDGRLLVRKPEDIQIFANLLNHAWNIWIVPELKRRKANGLHIPNPINSCVILFDGKNKFLKIHFNEEYGFKAEVGKKLGISFKKNDPILFDYITDIHNVETPNVNNQPISFFILRFFGNQISVYFDATPNDPNFKIEQWQYEELWLANAFLETILARTFGHLTLLIPNLSEFDIPFTIGLSTEKMSKICRLVESGLNKKNFENKINRMILTRDIEKIIQNWFCYKHFKERYHLINEVLRSFKRGNHGSVVLILMAQVEGIITEELIGKNKGVKVNGKAKEWTTRLNEFRDVIRSKKIGPLTNKILEATIYFLKESSLYKPFRWTEQSDNNVNRHASMHGKEIHFNTRINAIRMIFLFDSLNWIFTEYRRLN